MLDAVLEFSEFSASESGSESSPVYPQPPVGGKSIIVFPAALLSLADPERHSLGSRFRAPHRVLFHSGLVFRPHCELPSVHYSVCWMSLLLVRQYTFSLPRTYQYPVSFPHLFLFFPPVYIVRLPLQSVDLNTRVYTGSPYAHAAIFNCCAKPEDVLSLPSVVNVTPMLVTGTRPYIIRSVFEGSCCALPGFLDVGVGELIFDDNEDDGIFLPLILMLIFLRLIRQTSSLLARRAWRQLLVPASLLCNYGGS